MAVPLDQSPVLWLKADAGITLTAGKVSAWADQSGIGNNVAQGTDTKQPTKVDAGLNSLPVVRFDGGDVLASSGTVTASLAFSLFIVQKATAAAGTQCSVYNGASGGNGYGPFHYLTNRIILYGGAGIITDGAATNAWEIWAITKAVGSAAGMWINAASQSLSGSASPVTPSGALTVGCDSGSSYFTGDIAEVLLFASALDETNRTAVYDYLYNRWFVPPANPKAAMAHYRRLRG